MVPNRKTAKKLKCDYEHGPIASVYKDEASNVSSLVPIENQVETLYFHINTNKCLSKLNPFFLSLVFSL